MIAPASPPLIRWILAAPVVFAVHDGEELAAMVPWLRAHRTALPDVVRPYADISTRQLALAMLVLFAGLAAASWHGTRQARRGVRPTLFLLLAGALVGNGLSHLGQALAFRGYTPGLATAVLIVLPYGVALGRRLDASGVLSTRAWGGFVVLGIVLQIPIIGATLLLTGR
jgi:hypothetical protein